MNPFKNLAYAAIVSFFSCVTVVASAEPQFKRLLTRDGLVEGMYEVGENPRTPASALAKKQKNHEGTTCFTWFDSVMTSMFEATVFETTSCLDGTEFRFKMPSNEGELVWELRDFIDVRDANGNFTGSCFLGRAYWFIPNNGSRVPFIAPAEVYRPIDCNVKG